jgi:long-subunit acyl-CoA synthetase (AMP-forming)
MLLDGLTEANKKSISSAQKVQKVIILPRDFSIQDDTLTSTMKLKRAVVSRVYQNEI